MGARETLRRLLLRNWAFGAPCWKVMRMQRGCSVGGRVVLQPLLELNSMSSSYLNMGIIFQSSLFKLSYSFCFPLSFLCILCTSTSYVYQNFLILRPFLFFCVRLVYIYILRVSSVEAISLWVSIEAFSFFLLLSRLCIFVHIHIWCVSSG